MGNTTQSVDTPRELTFQPSVENLRPGNMDRLKLGYEDLRKVNPGIILASTSGMLQSAFPIVEICADLLKATALAARLKRELDTT